MAPATVSFALQDSLPLRAMAAGGLIYLAAAIRSTRSFGFFLRRTFQLQFELHQGYAYAREQARTDDLTGLANRRAFMELGRSALDQARRYERPLSMITFDIDLFKKINDTHGHGAGDETLRRIAQALRAAARVSDTTGRLGGEEFGVLLPETSIVEAEVLAERLRRDIAELRIEHQGVMMKITCSFGVVEQNALTPDFDSLLRAADGALYRAKDAGRNRVIASTD
jgi:diguanylate cyclase (GGDEF)-like protein